MDSDELLSLLLEQGVIDDKTDVSPSTDFLGNVDQYKNRFETEDEDFLRRAIESPSNTNNIDGLFEIAKIDAQFTAIFCALQDHLPAIDEDTLMDVAISLYFTTVSVPRTEGSPSEFIPIESGQIDLIFRLFPRIILYIWRDDCDPCDIMKEEFDQIFTSQPGDIGLFSIYGPASTRALEERFNVIGGPTTLFIFNSSVYSRLVGAQYQNRIRSEIEALRNQGTSP